MSHSTTDNPISVINYPTGDSLFIRNELGYGHAKFLRWFMLPVLVIASVALLGSLVAYHSFGSILGVLVFEAILWFWVLRFKYDAGQSVTRRGITSIRRSLLSSTEDLIPTQHLGNLYFKVEEFDTIEVFAYAGPRRVRVLRQKRSEAERVRRRVGEILGKATLFAAEEQAEGPPVPTQRGMRAISNSFTAAQGRYIRLLAFDRSRASLQLRMLGTGACAEAPYAAIRQVQPVYEISGVREVSGGDGDDLYLYVTRVVLNLDGYGPILLGRFSSLEDAPTDNSMAWQTALSLISMVQSETSL